MCIRDSPRAAAEVLREREGLGRPPARRAGEDLPGAWNRSGLSRHGLRFFDTNPERRHQAAKPAMNITDFEQRVLDQKPVESGHYDSEYFTGDWRAEGNNCLLYTSDAADERS